MPKSSKGFDGLNSCQCFIHKKKTSGYLVETKIPFQSWNLVCRQVYLATCQLWWWCKEFPRLRVLIHLSQPIFLHCFSWELVCHRYLYIQITVPLLNLNIIGNYGVLLIRPGEKERQKERYLGQEDYMFYTLQVPTIRQEAFLVWKAIYMESGKPITTHTLKYRESFTSDCLYLSNKMLIILHRSIYQLVMISLLT